MSLYTERRPFPRGEPGQFGWVRNPTLVWPVALGAGAIRKGAETTLAARILDVRQLDKPQPGWIRNTRLAWPVNLGAGIREGADTTLAGPLLNPVRVDKPQPGWIRNPSLVWPANLTPRAKGADRVWARDVLDVRDQSAPWGEPFYNIGAPAVTVAQETPAFAQQSGIEWLWTPQPWPEVLTDDAPVFSMLPTGAQLAGALADRGAGEWLWGPVLWPSGDVPETASISLKEFPYIPVATGSGVAAYVRDMWGVTAWMTRMAPQQGPLTWFGSVPPGGPSTDQLIAALAQQRRPDWLWSALQRPDDDVPQMGWGFTTGAWPAALTPRPKAADLVAAASALDVRGLPAPWGGAFYGLPVIGATVAQMQAAFSQDRRPEWLWGPLPWPVGDIPQLGWRFTVQPWSGALQAMTRAQDAWAVASWMERVGGQPGTLPWFESLPTGPSVAQTLAAFVQARQDLLLGPRAFPPLIGQGTPSVIASAWPSRLQAGIRKGADTTAGRPLLDPRLQPGQIAFWRYYVPFIEPIEQGEMFVLLARNRAFTLEDRLRLFRLLARLRNFSLEDRP